MAQAKKDSDVLITLSTEIGRLQENKEALLRTLTEISNDIRSVQSDVNLKHQQNLENFKTQLEYINEKHKENLQNFKDQNIKIDKHDEIDNQKFAKINWYLAIGMGILLAAQFFINYYSKHG